MRVLNEMNDDFFKKGSQPAQPFVLRLTRRWIKQPAARIISRSGIQSSARTANQLLLSLWLALPFVLFLSSDWIGMIVLWHALSASTRLLQNSTDTVHTERSAPLEVFQGGYRER
jgi:hypothetical protein